MLKESPTNRVLLNTLKPSTTAITIEGKDYINFSSNDYLGLSHHPDLIDGAMDYLEKFGVGNSSSRLVSGNNAHYLQTEEKLASFIGKEKTLIFSSGYLANGSILPTITDRHSLILMDKLSHRSLIEGGKNSPGKFVRFNHKDYEQLEELLIEATTSNSYSNIWIVSDTLFSMDGDIANIQLLERLKKFYNVYLYLDDAHGIGTMGHEGRGLTRNCIADIVMGTFGKAFGSFGAFVGCSKEMQRFLINRCPGLIYTTALPPSVLGSIDSAIDLMPQLERKRLKLKETSAIIRDRLSQMGWDIGISQTHIIPIIVEEEELANFLFKKFMEKGVYLYPMRPPTVAHNSSRLRISLTSSHTDEQISYLLSLSDKFQQELK